MTLRELCRFIGVVVGAMLGFALARPYGVILTVPATLLGAFAGFFGGLLVAWLFLLFLRPIFGVVEFFRRRFR